MRRQKNRGPSTAKIAFAGAVLVLLIVGMAASSWFASRQYIPTDSQSLCATDSPPTELLVLLLDMSDTLAEPQRLALRNELDRIVASVPRMGRIETYAVAERFERLTMPLPPLCNPGDGHELNRLYENPEKAKKRWNEFQARLHQQLDALMNRERSDTSAIFEAVQASAVRTLDKPAYDGVSKRLVVVSDLMQNVPGKVSFYQGVPAFSQFETTRYFSEVRADLTDVHVDILFLARAPAEQRGRDLLRFWEHYLAAQGALVDSISPVYGAQ